MSELKPCPFCGGAAHFFKITDLDDRNFGGDGICCGSCPVTTDLMFSLMEDCKPKLAEAWNRRAQPAQAGQVLSDAEIAEVAQSPFAWDNYRLIEAAVLAKRVPMTESAWQNPLHPAQISDRPIPNWTPLYRLMSKISDPSNAQHFSAEAAAKAFGIVGKEG